MGSTGTLEVPVQGACALHDLPMHLLYRITRDLDLRSQRNLFLCSSQLYSRWQLQVPDHKGWQFVERGIKLLEAATLDKLCDYISHILLSVDSHNSGLPGPTEWAITCTNKGQTPMFTLGCVPQFCLIPADVSSSQLDTAGQEWSGMTQEQLWHRLTGAPNLLLANVTCHSHTDLEPASDELKLFARQTFDLLCTSYGLLTISMSDLEDSPEDTDDDCHFLSVWHSADRQGSPVWEIDGARCIVDPPNMRFNEMPKEVTAIQALLRSHPDFDVAGPCHFCPDRQVIHDFAYQGNVDIDAWIIMQREAAVQWHDHIEDFDYMENPDDIGMANLVAMQV